MSYHDLHPPLEVAKDAQGEAAFGWVEHGIFFARFRGSVSASVGMAHAARIERAISEASSLSYFADNADLASYDLLARSAFVRLVLAHRRKFSALVMLAPSTQTSGTSEAFAAAIGPPSVVLRDAETFNIALRRAAPLASQRLDPSTWTQAIAGASARR